MAPLHCTSASSSLGTGKSTVSVHPLPVFSAKNGGGALPSSPCTCPPWAVHNCFSAVFHGGIAARPLPCSAVVEPHSIAIARTLNFFEHACLQRQVVQLSNALHNFLWIKVLLLLWDRWDFTFQQLKTAFQLCFVQGPEYAAFQRTVKHLSSKTCAFPEGIACRSGQLGHFSTDFFFISMK